MSLIPISYVLVCCYVKEEEISFDQTTSKNTNFKLAHVAVITLEEPPPVSRHES